MEILDAARASGERLEGWSFGGGTVLARRFAHRVSRDVDIFVPDPQYLGYLSPRLNDRADALAGQFLETAISVKLFFPEGEIDFIASAPLTKRPFAAKTVEGRAVLVESTAEILAKKAWHRGADFTARDLFDFAVAARRESAALGEIAPILRKRRGAIRSRLAAGDKALRIAYAGLERLDGSLGYDDCVEVVLDALART